MAFTPSILKTFTGHTFVRSSVPYQITVDELAVVAGQRTVITVTFLTGTVAGNSVSLQLVGGTVLMTAATTSTAANTFQLSGSSSGSAFNFATAARLNRSLDRWFVITVVGSVVTLTARTSGVDSNLVSGVNTPGSIATTAQTTAGTEDTRVDNPSVGLAIYRETSVRGVFERLPEHAATPDSTGTVLFRMEEHLRPLVEVDDVTPQLLFVPLTSSRKRWYAVAWARSGSPASDGKVFSLGSETDPFTAVLGGAERAEFSRFGTFISGCFNDPHRFLTYRGRTVPREVTKAEVHSLAWYNWYTREQVEVTVLGDGDPETILQPEALDLEARIIYEDGTIGPWTFVFDDYPEGGGQNTKTTAQWSTGWSTLVLDAIVDPDAGEPVAYEVRIRAHHSHTVLSEAYRFTLVPAVYQEKLMHFVSSLGAWESLRTTGAFTRSLEHAHRELQRPIAFVDEFAYQKGSYFAESTGAPRKLIVSTAYLPPLEYRSVLDILGSPGIRLWVDAASGQQPMRIVKSSAHRLDERGTDDENLFRLDLELELCDPESVITP